jgi:hypothetical protein
MDYLGNPSSDLERPHVHVKVDDSVCACLLDKERKGSGLDEVLDACHLVLHEKVSSILDCLSSCSAKEKKQYLPLSLP